MEQPARWKAKRQIQKLWHKKGFKRTACNPEYYILSVYVNSEDEALLRWFCWLVCQVINYSFRHVGPHQTCDDLLRPVPRFEQEITAVHLLVFESRTKLFVFIQRATKAHLQLKSFRIWVTRSAQMPAPYFAVVAYFVSTPAGLIFVSLCSFISWVSFFWKRLLIRLK